MLAGTGINPSIARHMLIDELQLTPDQADAVVSEAYRLEAHPAEVGRQPRGRGHDVDLHVHRDHTLGADDHRVQVHLGDLRELIG